MPELPEIASRAREMNAELTHKTITAVEVLQPKSLNMELPLFQAALAGARIDEVTYRGKWIFTRNNQGWLLLNLGMGGEILLVTRASLPEKHRLVVDFSDGHCLSVNFWWFGYVHYVNLDSLHTHEMTAKLGPNATDVSLDDLMAMIQGRRTRLKSFLLDQSNLAGIGNAYIHDILFLARLHPMRTLDTLSPAEIEQLHFGIQNGLLPSLNKNGAFYEITIYGEKGGFSMDDVLIGYREKQPCPCCNTPIQKIRTGSTSSFICPSCQPL
jgi:formamidopyrimidine-DNA glycosylase